MNAERIGVKVRAAPAVLAGVLVGAAVTAAVGVAAQSESPRTPPTTPVKEGGSERPNWGPPRYQIAAWAHDELGSGHGAFVLDTRTGEVLSVTGRTYVAEDNRIAAEYRVAKVQR